MDSLTKKTTISLLGFLLLYLSWQAFHWLPGDEVEIGNLFFLPVGIVAVSMSWLASRRCARCPRLRWFWRLFALGLCAQFAGDLAMAIYGFGPDDTPFPSLADPPYLSFYLLIGLALIRIPVAPTTGPQQRRIALDLAVAILGGGMAIWYLVLAPTVTEGGSRTLQMATSIAYPVGDVVVLSALAIVALRWSPATLRSPLAYIAAGLALFVIADIAYGYALLHGAYSAGNRIDILWIGALTLFAVAATRQREVGPGEPETSIPARAPTERKVSWLPFGALGLGSVILLSAEWNSQFVPQLSLVIIAIVLAGLVALRQFLAQGELIRLQGELQRARDELARIASHDALTGVANRRSVDERLAEELESSKRHGRHLSILFVDVDHFKAVNDTHGHVAGDDALREFAATVRSCLRPTDILGRWGGEEFVVVLPETDVPEASQVGERIRVTVASKTLSFAPDASLTCSIGISAYPGDGLEAQNLLKLADQAVYRAKREGRNRVVSTRLPIATSRR